VFLKISRGQRTAIALPQSHDRKRFGHNLAIRDVEELHPPVAEITKIKQKLFYSLAKKYVQINGYRHHVNVGNKPQ
jgi:hypothetical protein